MKICHYTFTNISDIDINLWSFLYIHTLCLYNFVLISRSLMNWIRLAIVFRPHFVFCLNSAEKKYLLKPVSIWSILYIYIGGSPVVPPPSYLGNTYSWNDKTWWKFF